MDWCVQRRGVLDQVVVDGRGSDSVLADALVSAGFPSSKRVRRGSSRFVRVPSAAEYAEAHEGFLEAVRAEGLTHGVSPTLDAQVVGSMRRDIGRLLIGVCWRLMMGMCCRRLCVVSLR